MTRTIQYQYYQMMIHHRQQLLGTIFGAVVRRELYELFYRIIPLMKSLITVWSGPIYIPGRYTPPVPVPVPITAPVLPTVIIPPGPVVQINCGSTSNWTDKTTGYVWSADIYNNGGGTYQNCPVTINGTTTIDQGTLYCTHRGFGPTVLSGSYKYTTTNGIVFCEIVLCRNFSANFNVIVHGNTLATSLNVFQTAGKNTAYILSSPSITIPTGGLHRLI